MHSGPEVYQNNQHTSDGADFSSRSSSINTDIEQSAESNTEYKHLLCNFIWAHVQIHLDSVCING